MTLPQSPEEMVRRLALCAKDLRLRRVELTMHTTIDAADYMDQAATMIETLAEGEGLFQAMLKEALAQIETLSRAPSDEELRVVDEYLRQRIAGWRGRGSHLLNGNIIADELEHVAGMLASAALRRVSRPVQEGPNEKAVKTAVMRLCSAGENCGWMGCGCDPQVFARDILPSSPDTGKEG